MSVSDLITKEAKRLLDATYAALEQDDEDDKEAQRIEKFYASCKPHYAGDDENLTTEELNS